MHRSFPVYWASVIAICSSAGSFSCFGLDPGPGDDPIVDSGISNKDGGSSQGNTDPESAWLKGPVKVGTWQTYDAGLNQYLLSIWGSSTSDIWVVGWHDLNGLVWHWNGTGWKTADVCTNCALHDVWGTSSTNAWIVGQTQDTNRAVILKWDGAKWTNIDAGFDLGGLNRIRGSASDDIWATGDSRYHLHWNGQSWQRVPVKSSTGTGGVWSNGAADAWVIDNGTRRASGSSPISHWDGGEWANVSVSFNAWDLSGIWASGSQDTWVVGTGVAHWDGRSWQTLGRLPMINSFARGRLFDIWGSSADDVWAVGQSSMLIHWDGNAWYNVSNAPRSSLSSLWSGARGDVWILGANVQPNCSDPESDQCDEYDLIFHLTP